MIMLVLVSMYVYMYEEKVWLNFYVNVNQNEDHVSS